MVMKSIDVGSMFLMDLSVNESEISYGIDSDVNLSSLDNDLVFPQQNKLTKRSIDSYNKQHKQNNSERQAYNSNHYHDDNYNDQQIIAVRHNNDIGNRQEQMCESLSRNNSLDRLTNFINGMNYKPKNSSTKITLEGRSHAEIVIGSQRDFIAGDEVQSTSSSLSDQRFVRSSSTVTSSSSGASSCNDGAHDIHSLNSETGYNCIYSDYDINHERASTTTREDSGVLDMKDLVGSQFERECNSYDQNERSQQQQINFTNHDNIQISRNIKATNLINKKNKNSATSVQDGNCVMTISKPATNPTNLNKSNHNHHHNHHSFEQGSKKTFSASLPIEVPRRQMKKNLSKLKYELVNQATTTPVAGDDDKGDITATTSTSASDCDKACNDHQNNDMSSSYDDYDEFLEQEYNENHHNHYPMNEHEHFRADQDPMKLFESIQALARSLHEDVELFGSLPPKRTLESPIRPLALV